MSPRTASRAVVLLLSGLFGSLALSSALPPPRLFNRQASTPDGTCGLQNSGNGKGYHCPTGAYACCSEWGWCGDGPAYCGSGCQSAYGSCTGTPPPPGPSPTDPGTSPTPGPSPGPSPNPNPPSGRTRPGSVPYGTLITSCTVPGVVALTFDDGPHIYTEELLGILSGAGVHATFFVNGQNWGAPITDPAKQEILRRMKNDGHQIGSHSWSHPSLNSLDPAGVASQMTQLESAIISAIGVAPTYMRPPFFECNEACQGVMNELSYHIIISDLDTLDYAHQGDIQTSMGIFSGALDQGNPASSSFLVLAHDVHQVTVQQLAQYMIDTLKAKGYRAVTVGECLGDPAENWYRTL